MFYQIFLSPQVKRSAIINNKHSIYELPHELLNDIRLRVLANYARSRKSENFIKLQPSAQSFSKKEKFFDASKKLLKNRN